MKKHMLTLIGALGLLATLTSTKAVAQMPNMDMSWGHALTNAVATAG